MTKINKILTFTLFTICSIAACICILMTNGKTSQSEEQSCSSSYNAMSIETTDTVQQYLESQKDNFKAPVERKINIVFCEFGFCESQNYSVDEQLEIVKMIAETKDNNHYSVLEYYRDLSMQQLNFNCTYSIEYFGTSYYMYEPQEANMIKIYFLPVKTIEWASQYWSKAYLNGQALQICKNHSTNINTVRHELGHILGVNDYYSQETQNDVLGYTQEYVGGWDIMGNSNIKECNPSMLAYSRQKAFKLNSSTYEDGITTPIEKVNTNGHYTIKANAYGTTNDTIAISLDAQDIWGSGYKNINFWIEYRIPTHQNLDDNTPTNTNNLIVYRTNDNYSNNVYAKSSQECALFVFRKYDAKSSVFAGIGENDNFGESSYFYAFFPNGTKATFAITNVHFNADYTASFDLTITTSIFKIDGTLLDVNTNKKVENALIYDANGTQLGKTSQSGTFNLTFDSRISTKKILKFYKNNQLIAEQNIENSVHNLIIYAYGNHKFTLNVKQAQSSVAKAYIYKNENGNRIFLGTTDSNGEFSTMLQYGCTINITMDGYEDYSLVFESIETSNISLTKKEIPTQKQEENITDRIDRNWNDLVDGLIGSGKSIIDTFGGLL